MRMDTVVDVSEGVFKEILSELKTIRESVSKFITIATVHENNITEIVRDIRDHEDRLRALESLDRATVTRSDLEARDAADKVRFRWLVGVILTAIALVAANGIAIWVEFRN